jgi:excisionase family DNA binding protein
MPRSKPMHRAVHTSMASQQALQLALDDVVTEIKEKMGRLLSGLAPSLGSPSAAERLSATLASQLDKLVMDSVTNRLLNSQDSSAHARRNALMQLLVQADAPLNSVASPRLNAVVVDPDDEEMLTSEKAAQLLHVSRPHLAKLLDNGTIPGVAKTEKGHRRIAKGAILRYKAQMKERQAEGFATVAKMSLELGLYDDELEGIPDAPKVR